MDLASKFTNLLFQHSLVIMELIKMDSMRGKLFSNLCFHLGFHVTDNSL